MTDAELQRLLVLDATPGPALAITAADADAIIDAALAGAGFGPGSGGNGAGGRGTNAPEVGGAGPNAGTSATASTAAVGTKIAIGVGIALVAIVIALLIARRDSRRGAPVVVPPSDATIDAPIDAALAGGGSATVEPATPTTEPTASVEPATIDMSGDEPSDRRPEPPRAKPARREPEADATDLLGEANAKRAAKQWRESDALYARVVERAPKSFAAQTALIASASLHLEHLGDPKGAAQRFRRALALAPAGVLAEEARWGLAEAARAMKDTTAEAAALDAFLAHHGQSPLAERARARRAQLP